MLELDLMLIPFVEQAYSTLEEADQLRYQKLLEEQDQDMFGWFMGRKDPQDDDLRRIVELIREHAHKAHA